MSWKARLTLLHRLPFAQWLIDNSGGCSNWPSGQAGHGGLVRFEQPLIFDLSKSVCIGAAVFLVVLRRGIFGVAGSQPLMWAHPVLQGRC